MKLSIFFVLFISAYSYADVKEYDEPRIRGILMDRCLSWGAECELPAATQWCLEKGYSKAIYWEIESGAGESKMTRMLKSDQLCKSKKCDAFSTIVCYRR
ncbi:hypothetical protein [Marinagarivorans cellulosilyticus]|uniref:Uncharacterized protein n=1 Tax=Marinagarivorans cellulosilyticus TaxID=2721545 RepID=A0AAN1WL39_9GAMM|nr:hypothetical protein [Marinagarivorans cellulosilyticus]BCD99593.1 hypothetical protein MARGE09_P3795 [Marinagarivorans cellulosilyticus]